MPRMNGVDAARHIRIVERSELRSAPVVIIALSGHERLAPEASEWFDAFVQKPVRVADLRAALRRWIPGLVSS
jgi:CheY-like chemotaxis protein